jgi:tetratricopeptide (TPR) repeat protein
MEQGFVDILKQLVEEQGNSALTDARKCKTFLADYTKNEYKKESRLLLHAVEAGVAKAVDKTNDLEVCKITHIRELEEEGLSPAFAAGIVNALALVLRGDKTVTESPSVEKAAAEKTSLEKTASDIYEKAEADLLAGRYDKAVPVFKKLAESGHAKAQRSLAFCLENGRGVTKDKPESFRWYCMAAEQGDAEAQRNLGSIYEVGDGVTRDMTEAVKWYRKAAEQGDASDQYHLAFYYLAGRGVAKDKTEAVRWFRKAAKQGHEDAKEKLVELNC